MHNALENWIPKIIVLGPGGVKACLTLGCIKRLYEERDFLDNIERWVGVSAGAAISLLLVSGYSIIEIINLFIDIDITEDLAKIKLTDIKDHLGLIKNKTVEDILERALKNKFGYIPSLKQLYLATGIIFTAVTFNVDKMRPEFLDKDTEPELSALESTMMSMAIPVLIQPRKYKGDIYIDGGIAVPYPVSEYDYNENNILGLY